MVKTEKPFLALTAEELMSRDVVAIPRSMSLRVAAHMLQQQQISGAPVVDDAGRCVGVLSATDFVRWADRCGEAAKVHSRVPTSFCSEWESVDLEFLPNDEVRWHMTADPVIVTRTAPIMAIARMMVDAHIHRVIVVDGLRHPVGIVSSTDVLAAVAYADGGREIEGV
jgi:CBS-domain-containing membrane protein